MSEAAENVAAQPAEGSIIDTRYWHALDDGRVQCDVCPRACKLRDGQRGLCFVRGAEAGRIKLFSYGRRKGFCVDPIEKKPLNHFLPGTSVLSFGTAGCNLGCQFCQNWSISKSREIEILSEKASPEFYSVMDAANVDLKGFTEEFYKKLTLAHLEPVLDTLRWLKHESKVW